MTNICRLSYIPLWLVSFAVTNVEAFYHHNPAALTGSISYKNGRRSSNNNGLRLQSVPLLDEWQMLPDGRVEGKVSNHPFIEDGSVIATSPLAASTGTIALSHNYNGQHVGVGAVVETYTGSRYQLVNPISMGTATINRNLPQSGNDGDEDKTKTLLNQIKDAGLAGAISYALWEGGFWTFAITACIAAYKQFTGHWPDLSNQEDLQQLGAEAFAFTNVARFAVPFRIGLALSTAPFVQENIIDRFSSRVSSDSQIR